MNVQTHFGRLTLVYERRHPKHLQSETTLLPETYRHPGTNRDLRRSNRNVSQDGFIFYAEKTWVGHGAKCLYDEQQKENP